MSTVLSASRLNRITRFYDSTIGKKAVMAVSGLILFGFLIAHMLGNLQFFLGRAVMNHYAETLHANPPLLWTVRIVLLISVILHIWSSIELSLLKRQARPVGYVKRGNVQASLASRTMMWSGPVVLVFIVFHLLHLTTGTVHPQFVPLDAYDNLVYGLRVIPVALFYIVAMILVAMHLSHGAWSMFQSLGFSHPEYTPLIKKIAAVFSWLLVAGFVSIPIAIMAGIVGN
jgi:succinate dehydrogenase cytochrome b subunit